MNTHACINKQNKHTNKQNKQTNKHIHTHTLTNKQRAGERLVVQGPAVGAAGGHKDGADFLLMAGEPLREPILASGPFVESDAREVSGWVQREGAWFSVDRID
jgi:redox-sensitive bicupin YhaK (pirin superfamily)